MASSTSQPAPRRLNEEAIPRLAFEVCHVEEGLVVQHLQDGVEVLVELGELDAVERRHVVAIVHDQPVRIVGRVDGLCLAAVDLLQVGLARGDLRSVAFDQLPRTLCVVDDRLDLAAMADDAVVLEQAIDIALGEARNPYEVEFVERRAEILALGEDGAPAEAGLETLQAQLLE